MFSFVDGKLHVRKRSRHPPTSGCVDEQVDAYLSVLNAKHEPPGLAGEAVIYPLYEAGESAHLGLTIAIRMLRETGWTGRVQIWHVGSFPDLSSMDVELYDMRNIPNGGSFVSWAAKSFALEHCGLEKAVVADWDAYCVENPRPLFDALDQSAFLWWGPNGQQWVNWDVYGRLGLTFGGRSGAGRFSRL